MWNISKEIKKQMLIDELRYLSKRPFYYNFVSDTQKAMIDFIAIIAKDRLFDIEIRQYRDMWE